MTNVLVAGGSGLVGSFLCKKLKAKKYQVAILSRDPNTKSPYKVFGWDDDKAVQWADVIVNIAGAGVIDARWTRKYKKAIVDSRVKTTEKLFKQVQKSNTNLKAYISASAIGYYGMKTSDKVFRESDKPGRDFLARVCEKWEAAADKFKRLKVRTVKIRTAVVLSPKGGALAPLARLTKFFLASPIGSGKQYFPWIHIEDLCDIYIHAIENTKLTGAYNAVSPDHSTNKQFMQALAKTLHRPCWPIHVPSFIMRLILGERASTILQGSRIYSGKIRRSGFEFKYTNLDKALNQLL